MKQKSEVKVERGGRREAGQGVNGWTRKKEEGVCGGHSQARPFLEEGEGVGRQLASASCRGGREGPLGTLQYPLLRASCPQGKSSYQRSATTSNRAPRPPLTQV